MTVRPTLALAVLLAVTPALRAAEEAPPVPADGAPAVTTASGLVYSVLKAGGEGRKPKEGDLVSVHYTGWTKVDGKDKVFDSSRARGKPADFKVGELIAGWNEALQLMTAGAQWKLTIPPALAYGDQATPGIPAGSTLIFELELLSVRGNPAFTFRPGDTAKQTTTASGLKVEVLAEGTGPTPTDDDLVEVAYALWTKDGKLVQSTTATTGKRAAKLLRVQPKKLGLPGIREAVLTMKVGTRLRLEVPPNLAFGAQNQPDLPPNSLTIWELEMLDLKPSPYPKFRLPDAAKSVRTASGLEIETVKEGTGKQPTETDTVTVDYTGWLLDGTRFDSSLEKDDPRDEPRPVPFGVTQVIKGWTETLLTMKEGGEVYVRIPAGLAYGSAGAGTRIPPNATLVFYVKLLKIGG